MADFDWSQYEEKPEKSFDWAKYEENPKESPKPTEPLSWKQFLSHALGGGAVGLAQGLSDVGANVAQFPFDVYSYLSGKPGYKVPKPDIRGYAPSSDPGQVAELVGEYAGMLPLGVAAPEALGSSFLKKAGLGALSGAAQSEDRGLGAILGATLGPSAGVYKSAKEFPWTQASAAKPLSKAQQLIDQRDIKPLKISKDVLSEINEYMKFPGMAPKKMALDKLLKNANKGDYKSLFTLQSDLGKIGRQLKQSSMGSERLLGEEVGELKNKILQGMQSGLEEQGHHDISSLMKEGRARYAKHMKYKPALKVGVGAALGAVPGYNLISKLIL